ncbi:MAG: 2-C-methyl-D-erythritol 2,4-cyclodiphosphate synthase [Treponema sp.]|nr:2-C-methyl-D-erythritol 2,4-cyclodiphosphate synthase [Treponema sp.]
MPLFLILTAAGSSSRMGSIGKKEYLPLAGGKVLSQSLKAFLSVGDYAVIIITIPKDGEKDARAALSKDKELEKITAEKEICISFIEGGKSRQDSIHNALEFIKEKYIPDNDGIVLVHDAARPYITKKIIQDCISSASEYGAAVPAIAAVDTQKEINPDGTISRHLVRKDIVAVQTPQAFRLQPFIRCHELASKQELDFTDDSQIWDSFPELTGGKKVHLVDGDIVNQKITYQRDLPNKTGYEIRIGMGTDLHRLVEGRKFILGGVEIPANKGELGHSDGDVLLHAIADALLGASGLGDIGSYFPPEEAKWKDADSSLLLRKVWDDVRKEGWELVNLDCVLEFEQPKFLSWRQKVIESIAEILETEKNRIFVKAKTNEGLDSVGSNLAIKAYCSCLLSR